MRLKFYKEDSLNSEDLQLWTRARKSLKFACWCNQCPQAMFIINTRSQLIFGIKSIKTLLSYVSRTMSSCYILNQPTYIPIIISILIRIFLPVEKLDSWIISESSKIKRRKRDRKIRYWKSKACTVLPYFLLFSFHFLQIYLHRPLEAGLRRLSGLVFLDVHHMFIKKRIKDEENNRVNI